MFLLDSDCFVVICIHVDDWLVFVYIAFCARRVVPYAVIFVERMLYVKAATV